MPKQEVEENQTRYEVTLEDISILAERAANVLDAVRDKAFRPAGVKVAPVYGASQLAKLCGLQPDTMLRRLDKADEFDLPSGTILSKGETAEPAHFARRRREFSLDDAMQWIRASGRAYKRGPDQRACVIAVGIFKGGTGKTTLSMGLCQGLSLKGYRVLAVDFDPQGSLTSLFGVDPSTVGDESTVLPIFVPPNVDGYRGTLRESIRGTYWSGVDLLPASSAIFNAEFYLPMRQMSAQVDEPGFAFNKIFMKALGDIVNEYDYIIIDLPPALSYVTMNAFWAADAILTPVPPEGIDFASSVDFWDMFATLSEQASAVTGPKSYSWISVVRNKVENKHHSQAMSKHLFNAYGEYLSTVEIPMTDAAKVAGTKLQTVYDISKYVGHHKTYERARMAYDALVDEVDSLTRERFWHAPVGDQ